MNLYPFNIKFIKSTGSINKFNKENHEIIIENGFLEISNPNGELVNLETLLEDDKFTIKDFLSRITNLCNNNWMLRDGISRSYTFDDFTIYNINHINYNKIIINNETNILKFENELNIETFKMNIPTLIDYMIENNINQIKVWDSEYDRYNNSLKATTNVKPNQLTAILVNKGQDQDLELVNLKGHKTYSKGCLFLDKEIAEHYYNACITNSVYKLTSDMYRIYEDIDKMNGMKI